MESKSNYTLVGLAVLILTTSLLSVALWLSVGFDRKQYDHYIVDMSEPVSGLNDESAVKYNGVRVGYVSDIELRPTHPKQVRLIIKIEHGVPITIDTRATLISQGITGATYLGLAASSTSQTLLRKPPHEPYPVIPYQPSFYYTLEKNIEQLSQEFNQVFTPENIHNITKIIAELESITYAIASHKDDIARTLQAFPPLMHHLDQSTLRFNNMATDVSTAGKQFTTTMKTGKQSLDQISQQTVPEATLLLQKLNDMANNLVMVSQQLRQNPSVILRGHQPLPPGPGE